MCESLGCSSLLFSSLPSDTCTVPCVPRMRNICPGCYTLRSTVVSSGCASCAPSKPYQSGLMQCACHTQGCATWRCGERQAASSKPAPSSISWFRFQPSLHCFAAACVPLSSSLAAAAQRTVTVEQAKRARGRSSRRGCARPCPGHRRGRGRALAEAGADLLAQALRGLSRPQLEARSWPMLELATMGRSR